MAGNNSVKKKYKVVYERKNCIGAGSCISVFPERWKMNSRDDKADLLGGKEEVKGKDEWIVEFTLDEFEKWNSQCLKELPERLLKYLNFKNININYQHTNTKT